MVGAEGRGIRGSEVGFCRGSLAGSQGLAGPGLDLVTVGSLRGSLTGRGVT